MGVSGLVLHYEQGESEVKDALKCAHKVIKESSKRNMLKYREQYNKKLKKDDYLEVGDLVEVLKEDTIPRTCRKLNKFWEGPFKVVERIGKVCYKLIDPVNPARTLERHARKLKRFIPRAEWSTDPEVTSATAGEIANASGVDELSDEVNESNERSQEDHTCNLRSRNRSTEDLTWLM